ncbi:MAG: hypothetical protein HY749_00265 [Gammaproteobacteria bacterium]|nr:hypothetical protein [Gammaproteobacteria bacterium]MBI5617128.1 hypothetical protein [Gammaproteobacteria bacterium]
MKVLLSSALVLLSLLASLAGAAGGDIVPGQSYAPPAERELATAVGRPSPFGAKPQGTGRLAAALDESDGTPQPRVRASIAVVYPDIEEPYRSVFSNIIQGIRDEAKFPIVSYAIGAGASNIESELKRQSVHVVIVLGRNGLKATANLDPGIGVVVGGVLSVPESEIHGKSVFSLAPDPGLLFQRLHELVPGARRVITVYEPRQNAWLIRLAREAAPRRGLELVAREATDLKGAMLAYREAIAAADPRTDAVWLPQDSVTVEDSSVLPLVLEEAWRRDLVVFSSSVAHVRRGALFALYPDNAALGRKLADSALARVARDARDGTITPLTDVFWAVNLRTASHLGVDLDARRRQSFDLVFPEP